MKQPKKKLIHKLKNRYRIVLINDTTFEEKFSFSLTPMNVFVGFSSFLVFFAGIITLLIVFTPLREYIPGYADPDMKKDLATLLYRSDSLEKALHDKEAYYKNILDVLNDRVPPDTNVLKVDAHSGSMVAPLEKSQLESEFVKTFEEGAKKPKKTAGDIRNISFFTPVSGIVSNAFNYGNDHYAVDVVTQPNEPVKAVQDGRIIISAWTPETGNILAIQHKNNLVSIYKHNALLLKKVGTFVNAGDAIAVVGNSGELTTGPHLHFELWDNGNAVNPESFVSF